MKLDIDFINKTAKLIGVDLNTNPPTQPMANTVYTLHVRITAK